jgi:hypothetical protein
MIVIGMYRTIGGGRVWWWWSGYMPCEVECGWVSGRWRRATLVDI